MNGVRLKTQVDTLGLSEKRNSFGGSYEDPNTNDTEDNSSDFVGARSNRHLQKFVEYVSYLKFLVTFVVRDVRIALDTLDEQDPISAVSFGASGWS